MGSLCGGEAVDETRADQYRPAFKYPADYREKLVDLMKLRGKAAVVRIEQEFGGYSEMLRRLQTSSKKGLVGLRDGLEFRKRTFGRNEIPLRRPRGLFYFLGFKFTDSILLVLLISAIVAAIVGVMFPELCSGQEQVNTAWKEAVAVVGTVIIILLISAASDFLKEQQFYRMQQKVENERKVTIIRSGQTESVCYQDLTVGDLCLLKVGTIIPADGVVIVSSDLATDETALTGKLSGKSHPVMKGQNDPLLFAGTHVVEGNARMIVLAVGTNTQAAKKMARDFNADETDGRVEVDPDDERQTLQGKLNKASALLGLIGVIIGIIVIILVVLRFSVQTYSVDRAGYRANHFILWIKAIILGLVMMIIVEPEGLGMAATLAQAHGINQMYDKNILVRNVNVVESVGNITTLCCNKTGVLTEMNKMTVTETVVEWFVAGKHYRGDPKSYRDKIPSNIRDVLCMGVALNTSYTSDIIPSGPGVFAHIGDRTECALLQFALDCGVYYPYLRDRHPDNDHVKVYRFTPQRKSMTTVVKGDDGCYNVYSKGAAEVMLGCCKEILLESGIEPLNSQNMFAVQQCINRMQECSGLKVMCLACKKIQDDDINDSYLNKEDNIVSNLTLIGIVGIESAVSQRLPGRRMVTESYLGGLHYKRDKDLFAAYRILLEDITSDIMDEFVRAVALTTSFAAQIQHEEADNLPKQIGDTTDCALLQFILELGETYQYWRDEYPEERFLREYVRYKVDATGQNRKEYAATAVRLHHGAGGIRVYCIGDVDFLIQSCKKIVENTGNNEREPKEFTEEEKFKVINKVNSMKKRSYRVLGVAYRDFGNKRDPEPDWEKEKEVLSKMTLLGYMGIADAVRGGVPDAIAQAQKASVKVCMVTGDTLSSAGAFAAKAGILTATDDWPTDNWSVFGCDSSAFTTHVLTSPDKLEINYPNFEEWWPNQLHILARASPDDKRILVRAIMNSRTRAGGEIVAVTAAGIEDGPVLRTADIGIAMGVSGTDVAKESADLVLMNDDFGCIIEAIKWGRNVYESVLKFLQFQFTVAWVAVIFVIVGVAVAQRSPLSATQLLWANLIMDPLAAFLLTRDPPNDNIVTHHPYGRNKPLVSRALLRNVILHSVYQLIVLFVMMFLGPKWFDVKDGYKLSAVCEPTHHSTMVFNTFMLMQLFNQFNCRCLQDRNVFRGLFDGRYPVLPCAWTVCIVIQILMVQYFTSAFHVKPLEGYQWLWCLFFAFSELIWGQLVFTLPKNVVPRFIRCCSKGVTDEGRGCCDSFSRIRGCRKVRRQDHVVLNFYGVGNRRKESPRHFYNSIGLVV